ncbi:DnaJ family domain-containing protein [Paenibacillus mendelii]|uniref:DnaJ family domain-containing protein n=1 Tax=Paenibacillus mendelii TaxID=206163 RepID=A0ABV6JHJ8_9BACL|nr:DnaJ family domain-containing protein [Paenibacillus mendelii]MCQ6557821.1 DUF1992 domain-containing protein [Paenibacillus mendelii]
MDVYARMAEDRIKDAMARGDFEQLPGKGKPLELEDLSHVPEELRVGYKLLKNAGVIPVEMQISKEMVSLQDLIAMCTSDAEREPLQKQLNEKRIRLRMLLESQGLADSAVFAQYEQKVRNKLEGDV